VFKADWFYGCVDRDDAQKKLETLTNNKRGLLSPPVFFIVRYANSKQLCFTFQNLDGKWENSNIDPNLAFQDNGYVKYVTQFQKNMEAKMNQHIWNSHKFTHETVPNILKTFKPFLEE